MMARSSRIPTGSPSPLTRSHTKCVPQRSGFADRTEELRLDADKEVRLTLSALASGRACTSGEAEAECGGHSHGYPYPDIGGSAESGH